jgi:hypothetical protein
MQACVDIHVIHEFNKGQGVQTVALSKKYPRSQLAHVGKTEQVAH